MRKAIREGKSYQEAKEDDWLQREMFMIRNVEGYNHAEKKQVHISVEQLDSDSPKDATIKTKRRLKWFNHESLKLEVADLRVRLSDIDYRRKRDKALEQVKKLNNIPN